MVQVIEQGDIFGRIGKSFGQGLSEQLPKEVDRYRLGKTLEGISEARKAGADPYDLAFQSISAPGFTPEMQKNVMPLLMTMLSRSESQKLPGDIRQVQEEPSETQPTESAQFGQERPITQKGMPIGSQEMSVPSGTVESSPESNYLTSLLYKNVQDSDRLLRKGEYVPVTAPTMTVDAQLNAAKNLINSFPGSFDSLEKAQAYVSNRLNQEKSAFSDASDIFDSTLGSYLQKTGAKDEVKPMLYEDLGDAYNRIKNKYMHDVLVNQIPPDVAANNYANIARDLANTRIKLKDLSTLDRLASGGTKSLKDYINVYKNAGAEDLAIADLKSANDISDFAARSEVFPVSNEVRTFIKQIPTSKLFSVNPNTGVTTPNKALQNQILDQVFQYFRPGEDSFFSYVDSLKDAGLSMDNAINYVKKRFKDDERLKPFQKEELADIRKQGIGLNDLYFKSINAFGR